MYRVKLHYRTFNSENNDPNSLIQTCEVRGLVTELRKSSWQIPVKFFKQIHLPASGKVKVLQARYLINATKNSVAGTAGMLGEKFITNSKTAM